MRKAILSLSCLVLILLATTLVAAPASDVEPAVQETETVQVEQELAPVAEEEPAPAVCDASGNLSWGPNYCGDPCSPNGSMTGCIDTSSNPWRRTICTCSNGYLVC